jgi:hypothetical protein
VVVAVERQGGGRSGQRTGRGGGQGRGGRRGRGNERRTYANNVDITDPHRNFTSDEWERLGSRRSYVLQLREGGRGGRGRGDRNQNDSNANRTTSSVATNNNNKNGNSNDSSNGNNVSTNNSVVSEITERGSQNGRSFGRGVYNNT